tara:strand:- start:153 stop:395 length:243 start_codon:yes stop_codon:yes gene_type:complete
MGDDLNEKGYVMLLDEKRTIRVNTRKYTAFEKVCVEVHGRKPNELIREFMDAITEGRVKFTPTEEQLKQIKQSTELYHVN